METKASAGSTGEQLNLPDRILLDRSFDADLLRRDVQDVIDNLNQQHYIYYMAVRLDGPSLAKSPYIEEMVKSFKAEVHSVRMMRLEAGGVVKEHTDPTLDAGLRQVVRLTIPVFSTDDVTFLLNDEPVPMKPGEVWYMRLSDRHQVINNGLVERINLSIDLVYNDWLEEKLLSCSGQSA